MVRPKRRAVRRADVEYDREADSKASLSGGFDDEREVLLDDDDEPGLTGKEFYESERPPHY